MSTGQPPRSTVKRIAVGALDLGLGALEAAAAGVPGRSRQLPGAVVDVNTEGAEMDTNAVCLSGRLTRDPEVRMSQAGKPWCVFTLAVNDDPPEGGQQQRPAVFIPCVCFGKAAESLAANVRKGDPAFVLGRLAIDTWTDKEGKERTTPKVVCSVVKHATELPVAAPRPAAPASRPSPAPAPAPAPVAGHADGEPIPF